MIHYSLFLCVVVCRFHLTAADASDEEMTAEVNIIITNTVANRLHCKSMCSIYPGGGTKCTSYLVAVYVLVAAMNMCGSQSIK